MSKDKKPAKPDLPRRDENGKPICGAKTKRGKGICTRPPMANGRCYHHGGATPAPGPTHPNYKHGRLSKYLPAQLATRFEAARNDPELCSMQDDVALIDAMRSEVAERLESGESGLVWKLLKETWGDFEHGNRLQQEAAAMDDEARAARLAEAREIIATALGSLRKLIMGGASEENRRAELIEITNNLVSVKASENSRQNRAQTTMTAAEAALFLFHVQSAVAAEVKDTETLRRIGYAFNYILDHGVAPPPRDLNTIEAIPAPQVTAEEKKE